MNHKDFNGYKLLLPESYAELNGEYVHVRRTLQAGDRVYGSVHLQVGRVRVLCTTWFELSACTRKYVAGDVFLDATALSPVDIRTVAQSPSPDSVHGRWAVELTERNSTQGETLTVSAATPAQAEYRARHEWSQARGVGMRESYKRMKTGRVQRV